MSNTTALQRNFTLAVTRTAICSGLQQTPRTFASHAKAKKEGDISSVFVSLSGAAPTPLPNRFIEVKRQLLKGNEDRVVASWKTLLKQLKSENEIIAQRGPSIVPQIEFEDLQNAPQDFIEQVKKRGVAVVRGVVPEEEARQYKADVEEYVAANPWTKAFPSHKPAVFELYWSPSQIRARSHPNLISTQRSLMNLWHSSDENALISTANPFAYADRVRIRQPGDSGFALGPHVDGGSLERWEPEGYGLGNVYDKIWQGKWEEYDPWESSCRIPAVSDLYNGGGACSMFRMFQGWLSMSHTAPKEGTLLVNPLLQLSTAYFLLRPFFGPLKQPDVLVSGQYSQEWLAAENWALKSGEEMTSDIQGANPGHAQELNQVLHPHPDLTRTMVHVPNIKPGDFVVWHCDSIHAVDKVHMGQSDSSVMYIPVCPITEANAEYIVRQRETFLAGYPGPDFPGGKGESEHFGRPTENYLRIHATNEALGAMGLAPLSTEGFKGNTGAGEIVRRANQILGF